MSAAALADLAQFCLARRGQAGIVYCRRRAECDEVAAFLRRDPCDGGGALDAEAFHAGRDRKVLDRIQRAWHDAEGDAAAGDCDSGGASAGPIVVATVAFGLGVDKADVRWVVHWRATHFPPSLCCGGARRS